MKRKIIMTTIFFIIIIALFFSYQANRNFLKRYPRVQASLVTRGDLIDDMEVAGIVNPDDVRDLYLSSGKILTIHVKEGDPVRAGQVLAIMDPDAKKVELAQCESNIVRLEQELAQKKLEGYSLAGIQVKEADLKTEYSRRNLLQKELRELTVTAPINGRVSLLLLKAGDYVDPDAPRLGQIVNDALLTVEAEVLAEDAIKIKPDDSAEIRVATIREPYPAKVIQVLPPIKKTSSSFSNPRVKLALQPGVQLIPGTSVRVRIRIDRAKLAVTVPVEAIYEETIVQKGDRDYFAVRPASGKVRKYVYVLKDCSETLGLNREQEKRWMIRDNVYQARKIYVETGISSTNKIEIIKGLKPFEQVVIYTDRKIQDFSRVIVINRDESYKQPMALESGG